MEKSSFSIDLFTQQVARGGFDQYKKVNFSQKFGIFYLIRKLSLKNYHVCFFLDSMDQCPKLSKKA